MNGNNKLRHLFDLNKKLLLKYFCNIYYSWGIFYRRTT